MGGKLGAVVFRDLILSDNLVAGFEVEEDVNKKNLAISDTGAGKGFLDGAIIIGFNDENPGDAFGGLTCVVNTNAFPLFIGLFYGPDRPHIAALGVITPRSERYWIKNVFFAQFDWAVYNDLGEAVPAAAIGSCSHCYSDREGATDSDARTTFFEGISYTHSETTICEDRAANPFPT